jgi:hypothetical protein
MRGEIETEPFIPPGHSARRRTRQTFVLHRATAAVAFFPRTPTDSSALPLQYPARLTDNKKEPILKHAREGGPMKRILLVALAVVPLVFFGGRLLGTLSANSAVTRFWSGWKLSQSAALEEVVADGVKVEDRTGFLTRLPQDSKDDVIQYFTDELFWWGSDDPPKTFTILSTQFERGTALVTARAQTNVSGRDYIYMLHFTLVKGDTWKITRIVFVEIP